MAEAVILQGSSGTLRSVADHFEMPWEPAAKVGYQAADAKGVRTRLYEWSGVRRLIAEICPCEVAVTVRVAECERPFQVLPRLARERPLERGNPPFTYCAQ